MGSKSKSSSKTKTSQTNTNLALDDVRGVTSSDLYAGGDLAINYTDQGAFDKSVGALVEGLRDILGFGEGAGGAAFQFADETVGDALDFSSQVNRIAAGTVEGATRDAFDYGEGVAGEAFAIAQDAVRNADDVLEYGGELASQSIDAGQAARRESFALSRDVIDGQGAYFGDVLEFLDKSQARTFDAISDSEDDAYGLATGALSGLQQTRTTEDSQALEMLARVGMVAVVAWGAAAIFKKR